MTSTSLISALALLAATAPATASAEQPPVARVSFADLDLSHPDGIARLHRRVGMALDTVCGDRFATNLDLRWQVRQCRAKAQAGADAQVARAIDRATQQARQESGGATIAVR